MIDIMPWINKGWDATLGWAPKLGLALLVIIVGFWFAGGFSGFLEKHMRKYKTDPTLIPFIRSLVKISLKVIVVLFAISFLGFQMTSIVAILAAVGFAIGLALQGSLSNFAGGVLILFFKPFKVGDVIDAQGHLGKVAEIQIFNTIMKTPDNRTIIMPNGPLSNSVMANWSTEPTRRVDMTFGIGYEDNIDKARKVFESVINKNKMILKDPKPDIFVKEHGDSSVNWAVRVWVKSPDYWEVNFWMHEQIKKAFDANKISIPYPQTDVHIVK